MTITELGLTHKTVPTELLERVLLAQQDIPELLREFASMRGVREIIALSTCNRLEIYLSGTADADETRTLLAGHLARRAGLPVGPVAELVTTKQDSEAIEHLFVVLCGLDSMAVGEEQIVAQFREAIRSSAAASTLGPVLSKLADAALGVSKRVRSETDLGTRGISLAQAGIALAEDYLDGLGGRRALLVGAGTVANLAVKLLTERGIGPVVVASRTIANATRLADTVGGTAVELDHVADALGDADLVVTAIGADKPILSLDMLAPARGDRPLFVLDLGMPRDVEAGIAELPGVELVGLAALGEHLAARDLPDDIGHAAEIIAAETAAFLLKQRELAAVPVIGALRSHAREVVERELLRLNEKLPGLDDKQRAETAATVQRVVSKLLHLPTVRVKELSADEDGAVYLDALSRLFDLPTRLATPDPSEAIA
ncbi:MAG TPA: glutamyl-tRNA reductase [Pseudonocardiaceae bacterium]|nr:glutamyl-tRNA reductase [Pseudonocardiaceae bacterium]